jgi:hypothetical protein
MDEEVTVDLTSPSMPRRCAPLPPEDPDDTKSPHPGTPRRLETAFALLAEQQRVAYEHRLADISRREMALSQWEELLREREKRIEQREVLLRQSLSGEPWSFADRCELARQQRAMQ